MKIGDYVFVYGTLRRGQRADLSKQAHNFGARFCGEDRISASMFHLGAYPGVKVTKPDFHPKLPSVLGEVFLIKDPSLVALMDAYEGYDADAPDTGLYDRCKVMTEKGREVWVYCYNPPVTSDQIIESGDWCKNPDTPYRNRVFNRA